MIADIQIQEVLSTSQELDVQYTLVQDVELAQVGGGSTFVSF